MSPAFLLAGVLLVIRPFKIGDPLVIGTDASAVAGRRFGVLERPDWPPALARPAALLHQDAWARTDNTGDLQDMEARFYEFQRAVSPVQV